MSYPVALTSPQSAIPSSSSFASPSSQHPSSSSPSYPSKSPLSLKSSSSDPQRDPHNSAAALKKELVDTNDSSHYERHKSPHHHNSASYSAPPLPSASPDVVREWERRLIQLEEEKTKAQVEAKLAQEKAKEELERRLQLEEEVAQLRAQLRSTTIVDGEGAGDAGEGSAGKGSRAKDVILVVSDTKNSDGHVSCHRCKTKKDSQEVMVCHSAEGRCAKKFCQNCLVAWHSHAPNAAGKGGATAGGGTAAGKFEQVEGPVTQMGDQYDWWQPEHRKGWRCPACMGCCHCQNCQKNYRESLFVRHQRIDHEDVKKVVQEEAAKRFRSLQQQGGAAGEGGAAQQQQQHNAAAQMNGGGGEGRAVEKKPSGRRSTTPYQQPPPPVNGTTPPPTHRIPAAPSHSRGESSSSSSSNPTLSRVQAQLMEQLESLTPADRQLLKQRMNQLEQVEGGSDAGADSPVLPLLHGSREQSPLSLHAPEQVPPIVYPTATAVPLQFQPRPPGLDGGELTGAYIDGAAFNPGTHARAGSEGQHRAIVKTTEGRSGAHHLSPSHDVSRPHSQPHAFHHQPQPHYAQGDGGYGLHDGFQQQQQQHHSSVHHHYDQHGQPYPQAQSPLSQGYAPLPVLYNGSTTMAQPLSASPQQGGHPSVTSPPHRSPSQPSYPLSSTGRHPYPSSSSPSPSYPAYPPPSSAVSLPYTRDAQAGYYDGRSAPHNGLTIGHQQPQQQRVPSPQPSPLPPLPTSTPNSSSLDGFEEPLPTYSRLGSSPDFAPLSPSAFGELAPQTGAGEDGVASDFLISSNSDSVGSQPMQMSGASLYFSQPSTDEPPRRLSDVFTPPT